MEEGRLVVKPMRYHCRLDGWTPAMEGKYGTYNARRDSLGTTWKKIFGYQHGIMVVDRFYEHVPLHKVERREIRPGEQEKDTILEFSPQPAAPMLVACLWNRSMGWGDEIDFYSFAAITDEPPVEVAAAGHDRCIVPIRRENLQAWLTPNPENLDQLQHILEDRDRPYYEHRLAA
jgi:putative SOS response-associated peptidase YedK